MENKYLTYDPIALAADDSFIKWVQSGSPKESPWGRWVDNNATLSSIVAEATDLVGAIQFQPALRSAKADALWNRINSTIAEETVEAPVVQMPRRNVFKLVSYAAAACVAALLAFQIFLTGDISVDTNYGESITHVLPDDSKIQINAGSSISYDEKNWSNERSLSLSGEAYFEVEKGQKFSVQTEHGTVSVLGTSFNIYSRPDGFRVQCTSGKVQVTSKNSEVILTPNMQTRLTSTGLEQEQIEDGIKVSWLNKIYQFEAIPLKVVFESIERQFDVEVFVDNFTEDRLYSGSYDATDLDKALKVVCFPMELSYEVKGNNVIIEPDEGN